MWQGWIKKFWLARGACEEGVNRCEEWGLQQCTPVAMCMSVNGIVTQPRVCIICFQAYLTHVNCEICMKLFERVQIVFEMQCTV